MILDGLKAALDATGLRFALFGWSKKPEGDYGIIRPDDQLQLRVDGDSCEECMTRGYVDFFTRSRTRDEQRTIENALRSLGIAWQLQSIQFEPDTGFIHYEWRFTDTNGNADVQGD